MPANTKSFIGCPVIVYDDEENYIAKTVISDHNKIEMYIEISADIEVGVRLNILIIHPEGAYEFGGVSRRNNGVFSEISLFREQQRSARATTRHELNTPATVNGLIIGFESRPFTTPLPIIIENISTTGALIKASKKHFEMGSTLEIDIDISGKKGLVYGTIIREKENEDKTFSFGCRFVFPK